MYQWLSPDDFRLIGVLPDSFNTQDNLGVFVERIVNNWLSELIGEDVVNAIGQVLLNQPVTGSLASKADWLVTSPKYMALVKPFLVYASWSEYILCANVTVTQTGLVTIFSTGSEPISDQLRGQQSRLYKSYAETYALKLSKLTYTSDDFCKSKYNGSGRPSLKTAGGKRQSRFD